MKHLMKGGNNVVVDALSIRPSISLMDVAENWKATLEVEYERMSFLVNFFMGLTMILVIMCCKEPYTTNI